MSDVKPLIGRRIIVTRAREQAHELSAPLAKLGASTIELPTIRIAPLADTRELDNAIGRVHDFDWTIFTSVNGVRYFWDRLAAIGRSSSIFEGIQVAAIGSATAAALTGSHSPDAERTADIFLDRPVREQPDMLNHIAHRSA